MSVCLHRREWRVHFYREDRISGHRVKLPSAFSLPFYRTLPPLNFALPLLTFNPFGVYLLFLHLFPFFFSSFFFCFFVSRSDHLNENCIGNVCTVSVKKKFQISKFNYVIDERKNWGKFLILFLLFSFIERS